MPHSFERTVHVPASPADVFARLDDQTRLSEHMEQPSAMMGGGRMTYEFDEGHGQAIGSRIKMSGSAFGISLYVDEVVIERDPPQRKVWKTIRPTRLIIIGSYEMGFELLAEGAGARLRVWITYDLPSGVLRGVFCAPLAALYARWCVGRMAEDAKSHFSSSGSQPKGSKVVRPNPS